MSAEAIVPDAVIPAQAQNRLDAPTPSRRHSRESGNPLSFARYPKYKNSGVAWLGEVPTHWTVAPLRVVAELIQTGPFGSQLHSEDYVEGEVPVINPSNIRSGQLVADRSCTVIPSFVRKLGEYVLAENDIVLARRGEMGRCAVVTVQEVGWLCGTGSLTIRLSTAANPYFICLLIGTENAKAFLTLESVGSTMDNLNASILAHLRVPVPPIAEQLAIAAFLDSETAKIDALIAEQKKLIALLKEKRLALISHAVTKGLNPNAPMKDSGIEWLGQVPAHWELKRLKHVKAKVPNAFVDGPFGSNLKSEHFVDDGDVYVIESSFATQRKLDEAELKMITSEHFATIQRSEVEGGDIVIAKIGAQFGKSAVLPDLTLPAVVSGNSMKLTVNPNECTTDWVLLQLENLKNSSPEIELMANGSAQPALSLGSMNELPILVPPLAEQRDIVEAVTNGCARLSELDANAFDAITLLKERRAALISAAVTGKIDVRHVS